MKRAALAGLLACVIVAISPAHASADDTTCPPKGGTLPNFRPTTPPAPVPDEPFVTGKDKLGTLADFRGKGVVLNFWATWCVPCVREMPDFSRLQDKLAADGGRATVVTLSQDRGGRPVVERFFDKKKISNLPGFLDVRGRLGRKMKVRGLPTTILINAEGLEVGRVIGSAEWDHDEALKLIQACVSAPAAG